MERMTMTLLDRKRVFYIEDDANNRAIVETILQGAGATISFEERGFVGLSLPRIRKFQPDVILLDLMLMHYLSGYDIYDTLRSRLHHATVPIVAVSASDPAVEIPKARKKGFAGFIGKPIDVHLFPGQIAAILRGETVWYAP